MSAIVQVQVQQSDELKFVKLLTPTSPKAAKLVNKFIKIMVEKRNKIDTEQLWSQENDFSSQLNDITSFP